MMALYNCPRCKSTFQDFVEPPPKHAACWIENDVPTSGVEVPGSRRPYFEKGDGIRVANPLCEATLLPESCELWSTTNYAGD
jgi:hypothetical protein